jgi:hypothetical protein
MANLINWVGDMTHNWVKSHSIYPLFPLRNFRPGKVISPIDSGFTGRIPNRLEIAM